MRRRKYGGRPPPEWDDAAIRAYHADKAECFRIMARSHATDCQCFMCTPFTLKKHPT